MRKGSMNEITTKHQEIDQLQIRAGDLCPSSLALMEHGCFNHYLDRTWRTSDPHCIYCNETEDTAKHTMFNCVEWDRHRTQVK